MDKNLRDYEKEIQNHINDLNGLKVDERRNKAKELLRYHAIRISCFQHERLVHLLVTFFFGGLLILGSTMLFIPKGDGFAFVDTLISAITAILFIVELFYIRHYYYLENGTQKLYKYSKKLFDLIDK